MEEVTEPEKRFYVAHVRGANFQRLREKGFVTYYPSMDDYVFLEKTPANEKLLRKQLELGVYFLKVKDKLTTINYTEMLRMFATTVAKIKVNAKILVVVGYGSNLEGTVLEVDGQRLRVELFGYRRNFEVWLDQLEVVEKTTEDLTKSPDSGLLEEETRYRDDKCQSQSSS